jgi:hypothetical protein
MYIILSCLPIVQPNSSLPELGGAYYILEEIDFLESFFLKISLGLPTFVKPSSSLSPKKDLFFQNSLRALVIDTLMGCRWTSLIWSIPINGLTNITRLLQLHANRPRCSYGLILICHVIYHQVQPQSSLLLSPVP